MRVARATLVFLAACGASTPPVTAETAPAIERVLDDWHDAASDADEARYFGHFTSDAIFLGTDATERWTVPQFREYAHPHFERGRAWSFRATRRDVVIDPGGRIAWFDEDLATEGLGPARGSGVLLLGEDGRWRIAQYNLAITVPNERFAAVRDLLAAPPPPPQPNREQPDTE